MALCPLTARPAAAIVNNNGGAGQAEDSLCVTFFVTDTIGNFAIADSFYVAIFGPWGDSVYGASYISSAAEIRTAVVGGRRFYRWMEDVADIDGSSPRSGTYAGVIVAVDTLDGTSAARLDQAFTFSFVLEPTFAERAKIGDTCGDGKPMALIDNAITAAKIANDAIGSAEINTDAWTDCWSSPSRTLTTDSFVIDLSSLNAALDNDTSLIGFLRAGIGGGSSGSCSGTGAYSVQLVCIDTGADVTVPGANVAIRSLDQSALLAVGRSDSEGRVSFNLDADSYVVVAASSGYLFAPFDTFQVTGSGFDSLFGYEFDPGAPALPSLCRVYGHLYTIAGTAEEGAVISAMLPSGVARSGERVISPFAVTTLSDTDGYFALDLIPSDSLNPSGAKYEFSITRKDGAILRQRVEVPAQTSWRLDW